MNTVQCRSWLQFPKMFSVMLVQCLFCFNDPGRIKRATTGSRLILSCHTLVREQKKFHVLADAGVVGW